MTSFRVGGAAEWLAEVRSASELVVVLRLAYEARVPVTILGGGSNVLVSDDGVRGLVVRVQGGEVEQPVPHVVSADAGVTINRLVRWTISRGLAALEAWAGTPGTVGGAIAGNAHFDGRLIGDLVESVRLASSDGSVRRVPAADMEFGYDTSRLQRTHEVLLSACFAVSLGDPSALRAIARRSLAYRKRSQPLATPSAGCVFRNPAPQDVPPGVPASAGALMDRAGLKGQAIGGARVSSTHANFIVNAGDATADEIRSLVRHCQDAVAHRFGVQLQEEIVYLGEFTG